MGCSWYLIFATISVCVLLGQCNWQYRNISDATDVVIAVDARNLYPSSPPSLNVFFSTIATDLDEMISKNYMHVSIVQFSDTAHVVIPLRNGTGANVIREVRLHAGKTTGNMPSGQVAATVRSNALTTEMGKRTDVPAVIIILARRELNWTIGTKDQLTGEIKAIGIGIGTKTDIIVVVDKYDGQPPFYWAANDTLDTPELKKKPRLNADQFLEFIARQVSRRLRKVLKTCPYWEDISSVCYYDGNDCVANITRRPSPKSNRFRGYCPRDSTYRCNHNSECQQRCLNVTRETDCNWTHCDRGYRELWPASNDSVTLFVFEACMKFQNTTDRRKVCKRPCITTASTGRSTVTSQSQSLMTSGRRSTAAITTRRPVQVSTVTDQRSSTASGDKGKPEVPRALRCTAYGSVSGIDGVMTFCLPLWLAVTSALVFTAMCVLITLCLKRAVYKRRLEAEKLKFGDTLRRLMEKRHRSPRITRFSIEKKTPSVRSTKSVLSTASASELSVGSKQASTSKSATKPPSESGKKSDLKAAAGKESSDKMSMIRPPSLTSRTIDEIVRQDYKFSAAKSAGPRSGPNTVEARKSLKGVEARKSLKGGPDAPETRKMESKLDQRTAKSYASTMKPEIGKLTKSEYREISKRKALRSTGYLER